MRLYPESFVLFHVDACVMNFAHPFKALRRKKPTEKDVHSVYKETKLIMLRELFFLKRIIQ